MVYIENGNFLIKNFLIEILYIHVYFIVICGVVGTVVMEQKILNKYCKLN